MDMEDPKTIRFVEAVAKTVDLNPDSRKMNGCRNCCIKFGGSMGLF